MNYKYGLIGALSLLLATGIYQLWERSQWRTMEVTATAYNSLPSQTTAVDPDIAAWGDRLRPGMQAIAVSRDLIAEGLDHRTPIRIHGLDGEWLVLDKMNKRWKRKIDIYMGTDAKEAREWGRRTVTISWRPQTPD